MIELLNDRLVFSYPEVHPHARLSIEFQRTLRIPDDDKTYPLPPGLGVFPLRHVDDFSGRIPAQWLEYGGVMLPMYQAEAMWLRFHPEHDHERGASYPFAIKVATGKIDAVTGKQWRDGLHRSPQDYMVAPIQPWLDGYCVKIGVIRQFVAMPLGEGYSVEEQLTGKAEFGGIQIAVYPMKREIYEQRFPKRAEEPIVHDVVYMPCAPAVRCLSMALAPGGRMKQEIYADPYDPDDWDLIQRSRCFVHLVNSVAWRAVTGEAPPTKPPTAKQYTAAGLPWFDYYDETATAVDGSPILKKLKSVFSMGKEKRQEPLPENDSGIPQKIIEYRKNLKKDQVREGTF